MRKFKVVLTFLALLLSYGAGAQTYSYGINAELDSLAVKAYRQRMDSIKQHRPTVALVLSGGGAKGAAHIGVLSYLEEIGMPIDLVVGTSIGGLVGGLYCAGHSAASIDSMIREFDWSYMLTDKVPVEYIPYEEKSYKRQFQFSMPFYYSREEYDRRHIKPFEKIVKGMEELHLGAESRDNKKDYIKSNLLSSLPSGFVFGQNVNSLFSSLTVGYQDDIAFWELPIPFVCVATELVTSKAKVWYSGKLSNALRSTMSIPGMFTPVRTDGMVLVDGGMRNNYPTDIAYNLGADFVIGVDISEGFMDYSQLRNFSNIAMQTIDMLGRSSYESNYRKTDVTVKPDITGYNMLSFQSESIADLIDRGSEAVREVSGDLHAMKELVGSEELTYQSSKAVNLWTEKVMVSEILIEGVTEDEENYLRKQLISQLGLLDGVFLGKKEIEEAVSYLHGTKYFDLVSYELLGSCAPYKLVLNCRKGPIHHIGVAGRLDTDEILSAMLNLGFNVHSISGHAIQLTGKIGTNPFAKAHYYYKTIKGPAINVTAALKHVSRNRFSLGEDLFNAAYYNQRNEVYLSNFRWINLDLKAGLMTDYYRISNLMAGLGNTNNTDDAVDFKRNMYLTVFLKGNADTFDHAYYPTKGFSLGIDYSCITAGLIDKLNPFHITSLDFRTVVGLGKNVHLLPFAHCRFILGTDAAPVPYANLLGGRMAGRYLDQQIPFMGITNSVALPEKLLVAGGEFRWHVMKNNYLSAIVNFADAADRFDGLLKKDSLFMGCGLQYSYNSIIGPFRADLHWSTLTHKMGFYVSIGFDF